MPTSSIYTEALDGTRHTIVRRARNYRNLIVAVVSVSAATLGVAAFAGSLGALTGLFVTLPVCGAYVHRDLCILCQWQQEILRGWSHEGLELRAFRHALAHDPLLPKETLNAMLGSIPSEADGGRELTVSAATREAVAAVALTLHRCRSDTVALRGLTIAILTIAILVFAHTHALRELGALSLACIPSFFHRKLVSHRFGILENDLIIARNHQDFDPHRCVAMIERLDWTSVCAAKRTALVENTRAVCKIVATGSSSSCR